MYLGVMAGTTTLPVIINLIMGWLPDAADFRVGLLYVIALAGATYVTSISTQFFDLACFRIGARARDAVSILVFEKMARLRRVDAGALSSPGQLHQLTAVDAVALEGLCASSITSLLIPVELSILIGLLWMFVQWAMLAGVGVLCLCFGAAFLAIRQLQAVAAARAIETTARVGLTHEFISSSLAVKLRAWESIFEARILARREAESRLAFQMGTWQAISLLFLRSSGVLVGSAVTVVYTIAMHRSLDLAIFTFGATMCECARGRDLVFLTHSRPHEAPRRHIFDARCSAAALHPESEWV